jgi:hypothetical protein
MTASTQKTINRLHDHDRQPLAARRKNQPMVTATDRWDAADETSECHIRETEAASHAFEAEALQTVA